MLGRALLLLAFLLLAAVASSTQARAVGFDCITDNQVGNCAIGEAQISVTLSSPGPTQVRFDLANAAGGVAAVIAGVYFDDDLDLLGSLSSIVNGTGVSFAASGSPPVLPAGNNADPAFDVDFRVNAIAPPPKNGVGPGETLGVIFDLASGVTVQQAQDAFEEGLLRVGLHVIAFGDEGSVSMVNVPEPSGLVLMALGLAALATLRRRRRAAAPESSRRG
jgi:hypothetical protein